MKAVTPISGRPKSVVLAIVAMVLVIGRTHAAADPLPSWNEGTAKKSIMEFVARVTKQGGPDFVPPAERIATFDNDGTLWSEQPLYFQLLFALDQVKALAPKHANVNGRVWTTSDAIYCKYVVVHGSNGCHWTPVEAILHNGPGDRPRY